MRAKAANLNALGGVAEPSAIFAAEIQFVSNRERQLTMKSPG